MERQLPKNVRQIGNVSDNPKIYVEDYVDTYLNQLREKAREQPVGVILTGELLKLEDENAVFVSGAVQMKEVKTNGNDIKITDEIMKEAKEEAARFFPECRIVGWGIIEDGSPMSRNREIKRIQEKEFAEEWNLFLWKMRGNRKKSSMHTNSEKLCRWEDIIFIMRKIRRCRTT